MPALIDFSDQLKNNEFLLRGGLLKSPLVITNLDRVQNRLFCKMCQRKKELRKFFSGQGVKSSLFQFRVADFLAMFLDDQQDAWGMVATNDDSPQDAVQDGLGRDISDDSTPRAPIKQKFSPQRKKALLKMRPIVIVKFPFREETKRIDVRTVKTKAEQPAFEATFANFRALFCWCQIQVAKAQGAPRPTPPVATHAPRKSAEGSEYYRKQRMCFYLLKNAGSSSPRTRVVRPS